MLPLEYTEATMRTEVHVHGSIFLCKGVRLKQVEQALKPWLEYLDVETLADAHSLEREEPGIVFDPRERTLLAAAVGLMIVLGIFPNLLLAWLNPMARALALP